MDLRGILIWQHEAPLILIRQGLWQGAGCSGSLGRLVTYKYAVIFRAFTSLELDAASSLPYPGGEFLCSQTGICTNSALPHNCDPPAG